MRVVYLDAVDWILSEEMKEILRRRRSSAIICFGAKTDHLPYQVWFDGKDRGYVASESAAFELLQRLGGSEKWMTETNWRKL